MEWFLSEGPHPIVGAGGAILAAAALVAALWLRQRALANRATVAAVFAADAGSVAGPANAMGVSAVSAKSIRPSAS